MRLFSDSEYIFGTTDLYVGALFLSGIFNRLKAYESKSIDICIPNDQILINLSRFINNQVGLMNIVVPAIKKSKTINLICWDGRKEFNIFWPLIKKLKYEKIRIHYVGQIRRSWIDVPYPCMNLFPDRAKDIELNQKIIKDKFPSSYKKIDLRHKLMIAKNFFKSPVLAKNYYFSQKLLCFFGAIKPNRSQLKKYSEALGVNLIELDKFFLPATSIEAIDIIIQRALNLKHFIGEANYTLEKKITHIEFTNCVIRHSIISYIRSTNTVVLTADYFSKQHFNAYESYCGGENIHIDFGVKIGFDSYYPRNASLAALKKKTIQIKLLENDFENVNTKGLIKSLYKALNFTNTK